MAPSLGVTDGRPASIPGPRRRAWQATHRLQPSGREGRGVFPPPTVASRGSEETHLQGLGLSRAASSGRRAEAAAGRGSGAAAGRLWGEAPRDRPAGQGRGGRKSVSGGPSAALRAPSQDAAKAQPAAGPGLQSAHSARRPPPSHLSARGAPPRRRAAPGRRGLPSSARTEAPRAARPSRAPAGSSKAARLAPRCSAGPRRSRGGSLRGSAREPGAQRSPGGAGARPPARAFRGRPWPARLRLPGNAGPAPGDEQSPSLSDALGKPGSLPPPRRPLRRAASRSQLGTEESDSSLLADFPRERLGGRASAGRRPIAAAPRPRNQWQSRSSLSSGVQRGPMAVQQK